MKLFLVIILAVMLGLDVYWWHLADKRLRPLKRAKIWRGALAVFVVTMLATLLTRMLWPAASRKVNSAIPMAIVSAQYIWHLLVLPVACAAPLLWRAGAFAGRLVARQRAPVEEAAHHPSRRELIRAAAVAVPPLVVGGAVIGSLGQLGKFRLRRFDLKIPQLPRGLDGMTIAHLSDFHVGRFMSPAMMRPVIDLTNEMKPDLVLVTGDLIDYALVDLPGAVNELLRLRPAKRLEESVFLCMGNHDVIEDEKAFISQVRASGLPLLVNDACTVEVRGERVQLLGIDWAHTTMHASADMNTAFLVHEAARYRDPLGFPILLAHHPHAFDEAVKQGLPLTLAGHTHGGQLMATPNFGAGSIMFRYWSGLYDRPRGAKEASGSKMVVSNGIGNWFPLRINAPAEMVHLTLRRA